MNSAISFTKMPDNTLLASVALFDDQRDDPDIEILAIVSPRELPIQPEDYWRWTAQLLQRITQDMTNE